MADALDGEQWIEIVRAMASAVMDQSDYLSSLDRTVGDGDHGTTLARAMDVAARSLTAVENPTPAGVLGAAGTILQNTMGGVSGALFGSFFIAAAQAIVDRPATNLQDVADMWAAGLAEVQKRGKAQPGDKTMVDALVPAVSAFQASAAVNASLQSGVQQAAESAQSGARATRDMIARFGRAKYLGERSLGYQDAGATSMAIILGALASWLHVVEVH